MSAAGTATVLPTSRLSRKGVMTTPASVEVAVMATDSATLPRARKVITLEAVPPATLPTNTRPTVSSGPSRNRVAISRAISGITVNCSSRPARKAPR